MASNKNTKSMMSRRGATITGAIAAGLTIVGGYAGAQLLALGPAPTADSPVSAVARATSAMGSLQAGQVRTIASADASAVPGYPAPQQSAPQASYSQQAPVAQSSAS